jgi:hypothetical protein
MRLLCYLCECLTSATGALSCAVGLTGTNSSRGTHAGGAIKRSSTIRATEPARSTQRAPRSHPPNAGSTASTDAGAGSMQHLRSEGIPAAGAASPDSAVGVETSQAPAALMPAQTGTSQFSSSSE